MLARATRASIIPQASDINLSFDSSAATRHFVHQLIQLKKKYNRSNIRLFPDYKKKGVRMKFKDELHK